MIWCEEYWGRRGGDTGAHPHEVQVELRLLSVMVNGEESGEGGGDEED